VTASGNWRVFAIWHRGLTIQVAQHKLAREALALGAALRTLLPFVLVLPLLGFLIWRLVGREVRFLETTAQAVAKRSPDSLEPIGDEAVPDGVLVTAPKDVTDGEARVGRQRIDDVRVLVVDDDADARDVMQRLLGLHGARVTTAASAQEALDLIGTFQPNILISDIGMPQEDGYDLIGRLRRLPPELGGLLPALALTAFARPGDGTRAVEAGYQLHLAKPVNPEELVRAVKDALANAR
jgi:CheY-like chemotaxis protein